MAEPTSRADRAVFGVVFLMLFAFSYSEQLVSGVYPVGDGSHVGWRVAVVIVDVVVLGLVGVMKRTITTSDGDRQRLWLWWSIGVVMLIGIDLVRLIPYDSIQIDLLAATVYAAAMGVVMATSLNADPMTLILTRRREALHKDWVRVRAIVPLVASRFTTS